ncbi:MAG: glutamate--tRNA ligase [Terriglobia bacterium]
MAPIRVRFAPSPTGFVHVGNARTALFNWLFARHQGGTFILRIEDTDVERSEERYELQLIEDLKWFGLDWDEGPDRGGNWGPYRQSERKELYSKLAAQLIEQDHAYFCFCTPEELEADRQEALKAGRQPKYSGRCRQRPLQESARQVAQGSLAAIRLKIVDSVFNWTDMVHGATSFSSDVIGDPIIMRSDGNPAYNFAVVVDDHQMEITHVIRGDDHISNTPRQLAAYRAFAWEPPRFAHLSTILGPDRTRLSKRHGATSLESFRLMGILPEALRNYLALLGWSPADGKTEILNDRELIAQFSLEHITKSPAVFDNEKLNWLNRHYLKASSPARLAELAIPFLAAAGYLDGPVPAAVRPWIERVVDAVLKNLDRLDQLPAAARVIFDFNPRNLLQNEGTRIEAQHADTRAVVLALLQELQTENEITSESFRAAAKAVQQETGKKGKELFHPIRLALTGETSGPELDKLVPMFQEGAKLNLPRPVQSVIGRLQEFLEATETAR